MPKDGLNIGYGFFYLTHQHCVAAMASQLPRPAVPPPCRRAKSVEAAVLKRRTSGTVTTHVYDVLLRPKSNK